MQISQEVRAFAKQQNQDSDAFIAASATNPAQPEPVEGLALVSPQEAEKGMAEMSRVYNEGGRELYIGAGNREHD